MQTYICLLRGINVSGNNIIKMDALKTMLSNLKYKNITTYIQSGNIVFQTNSNEKEKLEKQIKERIKATFKLEVPVLVLTLATLKKTIANNPFAKNLNKDVAFLHTTFLSSIPIKMDIDKIGFSTFLPDECTLMDDIVYLYCPNGYGNTKLTNTFFEKKLTCTATTRNWNTINKLIAIAEKYKD